MNNPYISNECVDHPLGILCRCEEYRNIVNKFIINTMGTRNTRHNDEITFRDPVGPATVVWVLQKAEANANPTRPVIHYQNVSNDKIERVHEGSVEKEWIPMNVNLVSAKELRPNTSYLHRSAQNTQSADTSVLTDMLPHRGRAVKRKDINWDIGTHETPVQMTDEPETNFSSVKGCFSTWAEAYTRATGRPAY